jgi:hypothetical protein
MSATLSKGQKVKVHYTDANGGKVVWDGVLKEPMNEYCWRVAVGGVAIVANTDEIEVINEKSTEGPVAPQG